MFCSFSFQYIPSSDCYFCVYGAQGVWERIPSTWTTELKTVQPTLGLIMSTARGHWCSNPETLGKKSRLVGSENREYTEKFWLTSLLKDKQLDVKQWDLFKTFKVKNWIIGSKSDAKGSMRLSPSVCCHSGFEAVSLVFPYEHLYEILILRESNGLSETQTN